MNTTLKVFADIIGITQTSLGGILSVLAYIIYADPAVQNSLGITQKEASLYMFLLLVIGIFLILSGLMLASKENQKQETTNKCQTSV